MLPGKTPHPDVAADALEFLSKPTPLGPVWQGAGGDGQAVFGLGMRLVYRGQISFVDKASVSWRMGFIQAQWIETNWASYKGIKQAEGSVFVQRGRPPARAKQACCDTPRPGASFLHEGENTSVAKPPGAVQAYPPTALHPADTDAETVTIGGWGDTSATVDGRMPNRDTGADNYLDEAQIACSFCTCMVLRGPAGQLVFLKSFYWNVAWQAAWHPPAGPGRPRQLRSNSQTTHVGHVIDGEPNDARFMPVLKHPQSKTCKMIAAEERQHPNVRQSRRWEMWDVRR